MPAQGELYGIINSDFFDEGDEKEYEFEPALVYGLADWVALEVHGHIEKVEGGDSEYESTSPAVHFRFTPRDAALALGLSLEYEIADNRADDNNFEATAIAGYESNGYQLAANVLFEKPEGGDEEFGFALAARADVSKGHALGIELLGAETRGAREIIVGYYGDFTDRLSVNIGVGTGIQEDDVEFSARTALIWKFI